MYEYMASAYFEKDSIKNKNYVLSAFDRLDNDGEICFAIPLIM